LLNEFDTFESDEEVRQFEPYFFIHSMIKPVPEFVDFFLAKKIEKGIDKKNAVRDLYGFLLKKRYDERLNLLYFALEIFDDNTFLPEKIVNLTPVPHEDGVPGYSCPLESEVLIPSHSNSLA